MSDTTPREWAAGDPCEVCGSRNTHLDIEGAGWCSSCGASDYDE